jgi:hypothetical protein
MSKLKVIHANPVSSFGSAWLKPIFDQYLEFEVWDPKQTYDKNTLFYLNCLDFPETNNVLPASVDQLVDRGFRVFIDNLWEVDPGPVPNTLRVCCSEWFWFNESLWYQHLGYDQYQPQYNSKYLSLMPMNRQRFHRTQFLDMLGSLVDNMLWSYVEQGRQLPNDRDMDDWSTQRYFNPDWYNECYMSMVVESFVRPRSKYTPIFITEKTFKPLAFQHPFLVYGNRRTLKTLQSWGFETFGNLWDERYDDIVDEQQRCHDVIEILKQLKIQSYDAETLKRLRHNRDHFFNRELVIDKIIKQIICPIIEYAETS